MSTKGREWLIDNSLHKQRTDQELLKLNLGTLEFENNIVSVVRCTGFSGPARLYLVQAQHKCVGVGDNRAERIHKFFTIKVIIFKKSKEARLLQSQCQLLKTLSQHSRIQTLIDTRLFPIKKRQKKKNDPSVSKVMYQAHCQLMENHANFPTLQQLIQKWATLQSIHEKVPLPRRPHVHFNSRPRICEVLRLFRQMAEAIAALYRPPKGQEESESTHNSIVHHYIEPKSFYLDHMPTSKNSQDVDKWHIKLGNFGMSTVGPLLLKYSKERMKAALDIEKYAVSPNYRSPEMVNLNRTSELTTSTDIWSLGCCFYAMLFLQDCFPESNSSLAIISGMYDIPAGHPYSRDVLYLLSRMLTIDAKKRASIDNVLVYINKIEQGEPIAPPKKKRKPKSIQVLCNSLSKGLPKLSSRAQMTKQVVQLKAFNELLRGQFSDVVSIFPAAQHSSKTFGHLKSICANRLTMFDDLDSISYSTDADPSNDSLTYCADTNDPDCRGEYFVGSMETICTECKGQASDMNELSQRSGHSGRDQQLKRSGNSRLNNYFLQDFCCPRSFCLGNFSKRTIVEYKANPSRARLLTNTPDSEDTFSMDVKARRRSYPKFTQKNQLYPF